MFLLPKCWGRAQKTRKLAKKCAARKIISEEKGRRVYREKFTEFLQKEQPPGASWSLASLSELEKNPAARPFLRPDPKDTALVLDNDRVFGAFIKRSDLAVDEHNQPKNKKGTAKKGASKKKGPAGKKKKKKKKKMDVRWLSPRSADMQPAEHCLVEKNRGSWGNHKLEKGWQVREIF